MVGVGIDGRVLVCDIPVDELDLSLAGALLECDAGGG